MFINRAIQVLGILALILHGASCTNVPKGSQSGVNVTGGKENYDAYREAVGLRISDDLRIDARCTGAIVRHDLILTAAHCVPTPSSTRVEVFDRINSAFTAKKITSTAILVLPTYNHNHSDFERVKNDVAFVVFPSGSFSDRVIGKIAKKMPKKGDEVNFVGYGNSRCSSRFTRDVGWDRIEDFDVNNEIVLAKHPDDGCSYIDAGDSGAPVFNRSGEIIGVVSGGGKDGIWQVSRSTNVNEPRIADFINIVLSLKNPAACFVPWYLGFMESHKGGKVTTIRKN